MEHFRFLLESYCNSFGIDLNNLDTIICFIRVSSPDSNQSVLHYFSFCVVSAFFIRAWQQNKINSMNMQYRVCEVICLVSMYIEGI
jgi:hypothetical protein